jgi:hypothetical protein
MPSILSKRVPLRFILRAGASQQPVGARSGECGGWLTIGEELLHNRRCVARCVTMMQKPLCCPCHWSRRFLQTASVTSACRNEQ